MTNKMLGKIRAFALFLSGGSVVAQFIFILVLGMEKGFSKLGVFLKFGPGIYIISAIAGIFLLFGKIFFKKYFFTGWTIGVLLLLSSFIFFFKFEFFFDFVDALAIFLNIAPSSSAW